MKKRKEQYRTILKLFFDDENIDSIIPALPEDKLERTRKFLKYLAKKDEKEVMGMIERLYGGLTDERVLQEDTFIQSIIILLAKKVFVAERVVENAHAWKKSSSILFDVLAYNTTYIMVINLYSTFEEPDLKEFISDLKRFKRFFKEYNDHIVLGGIGVLDIKEEPLEKTSKAGIYVFQRKADKTTLLNKRGFSPTEW